jgi:inorganic triphosphatase YgiF
MTGSGATSGHGGEEREVKLRVDGDFVLPVPLALDGLTTVDRGDERLNAVYWDTDDLALARAGVGTRHRNGVWTYKGASRREGDALVREEIEVVAPPNVMPEEMRARIARWADLAAVHPVARLDTMRRTVDAREGDERAEVVHDRVRVMDGEREVERFFEVEVEFEPDSQTLADRLVRYFTELGATVDTTPKYVRALRALGHSPPPVAQ